MLDDTFFERALQWVLLHEGGYVDDPADPGGATNYGITQRIYDAWRRRQGLAPKPVREITPQEVHDIYKAFYWEPIQGQVERWAQAIALILFDTRVHHSFKTYEALSAQLWLQGVSGYRDARTRHFQNLAQGPRKKFLKGWLNRLQALLIEAHHVLHGGTDANA